jgi:hypothetical protein
LKAPLAAQWRRGFYACVTEERPTPERDGPAPLAGGNRAHSSQLSRGYGRKNTKESTQEPTGAFAKAAERWRRQGFAPIPLGGPKGNEPLVESFTKWRGKPSLENIRRWARKWPKAEIGIVTGPAWGLTVVDVDDAALIPAMLARFGESPIRIQTPRGSQHFWYRSSGEFCKNLKDSEGIAVDIKGVGGFVVVPPSVRLNGEFAGNGYVLAEGCSWDSLADLPPIRGGALPTPSPAAATSLRAVAEGRRNTVLFRLLLKQVRHCDDLATLEDCARTIVADQFEQGSDPFTDAETRDVAASAWKYEAEGKNWAGREQRLIVPVSTIDALDAEPLKFLLTLRARHWGRPHFALSPEAMAKADVIPGWSKHRYRSARQQVLERGYLTEIYKGGSRLGDASLFAFAQPPAQYQNLDTI